MSYRQTVIERAAELSESEAFAVVEFIERMKYAENHTLNEIKDPELLKRLEAVENGTAVLHSFTLEEYDKLVQSLLKK
jgi:hypothetical protein